MSSPKLGRTSWVVLFVGALAIGYATFVAYNAYPPRPPDTRGDSFGLGSLVIWAVSVLGGILLASVAWRERLSSRPAVWWFLIFPLGAAVGTTLPLLYLLFSPRWHGTGIVTWYVQTFVVGAVVGVMVAVRSWSEQSS